MAGQFEVEEDRGQVVSAKESAGTVRGLLDGYEQTVLSGVQTAHQRWTGPRSATFTTAAAGTQIELRNAQTGVGEVAEILGDYASAIEATQSDLDHYKHQHDTIMAESSEPAEGGEQGPSWHDRAQYYVHLAEKAKADLARKAATYAGRIEACTDRVAPASATLTPAEIRREVHSAMGVGKGAAGTVPGALALLSGVVRVTPADAVKPDGSVDWSQADPEEVPIPGAGTDPKRVHLWWSRLPPQEQAWLIGRHPHRLGNLDGIPVVVRDEANRSLVPGSLRAAEDRLASQFPDGEPPKTLERTVYQSYGMGSVTSVVDNPAWARWNELHEQVGGIESIQRRLESGAEPPYFLIGFQPDVGNGRAIVSRGNPDLATHVSTLVPGTYGKMAGMDGDVDRSDRMRLAARQYTRGDIAAVTWMGYDAPQSIPGEAKEMSFAEDATPLLSSFQSGLRATHQGAASHNTVFGHSYGTTVVGHTAGQRLDADDVVLVASPGAGVGSGWLETGSVDDLHLSGSSRGHVYATRSASDTIKWATNSTLGVDPTEHGFGAKTFAANPAGGHGDYWNRANEAGVQDMGRVIAGRGSEVEAATEDERAGPNPLRVLLGGPGLERFLGR